MTGYLIGDDSTIAKPKGRKMAGVGTRTHFSTTAGHPVRGHSMMTSLYVLLGRRCPQAPRLYRQKEVCQREGVPFKSKIDLMMEQIESFEPVEGADTHVLVDSWFTCKGVWQVARQRGFQVTSGLKANRSIRAADPQSTQGWRWHPLPEYVASLTEADYVSVRWPRDPRPGSGSGSVKEGEEKERTVYAHVITTRVRVLYKCQVLVVRCAGALKPLCPRCRTGRRAIWRQAWSNCWDT